MIMWVRSSLQMCFLRKGVLRKKKFSIWVFFHEHSRITGLQGKGGGISLTPHYHFHPLHRYLDVSRAITAESSDLSREPLVSERKSLTTKLRAWGLQLHLKSLVQKFSCEFFKISKNTFFTEHLWTTASTGWYLMIAKKSRWISFCNC